MAVRHARQGHTFGSGPVKRLRIQQHDGALRVAITTTAGTFLCGGVAFPDSAEIKVHGAHAWVETHGSVQVTA